MRLIIASDEPYGPIAWLAEESTRRGHTVTRTGALADGAEHAWVAVAEAAAGAVSAGLADQAMIACWTGTGVCMAANKLPGVRAALCTDAPTARGARVWNHANVLCLSNRSLSLDVAREILDAWLHEEVGGEGGPGVAALSELDARTRRPG